MSRTIELPDPLFAEINGYANRVAASPIAVIRQAWDEFRLHHPPETDSASLQKPAAAELLAMVRFLRGSLSLPQGLTDETLIIQARIEKYGPL